MSRLFRFFLLLAGAGALIAVLRHLNRSQHESQQPFFADAYTPPAPARPVVRTRPWSPPSRPSSSSRSSRPSPR